MDCYSDSLTVPCGYSHIINSRYHSCARVTVSGYYGSFTASVSAVFNYEFLDVATYADDETYFIDTQVSPSWIAVHGQFSLIFFENIFMLVCGKPTVRTLMALLNYTVYTHTHTHTQRSCHCFLPANKLSSFQEWYIAEQHRLLTQ